MERISPQQKGRETKKSKKLQKLAKEEEKKWQTTDTIKIPPARTETHKWKTRQNPIKNQPNWIQA
ncbi:OLC1v1012346C1 [Oldenlandia corymbosa var. corymbosa]|uniref:OLC1v1012346C1 n=1 Tax=Oldenlandia corymbosa var. corymbosa TaxID=529605 RepID=A0AAV1DVS7_OLDCO|nr:OLC1v1012346C1 [Oldenlandia corymbosa var. corymbosa]